MEKTFLKAEALIDTIDEYVENRIEIAKIETVELASKWLSRSIVMLLISLHLLLFIIFFSIAVAIILGTVLNNPIGGYLIVAFAYLVAILIIWKSRNKWIRLPLLKLMAVRFLKPDSEYDEA